MVYNNICPLFQSGKRELFEMGRWLHRRYGDFMGPYYRPEVC